MKEDFSVPIRANPPGGSSEEIAEEAAQMINAALTSATRRAREEAYERAAKECERWLSAFPHQPAGRDALRAVARSIRALLADEGKDDARGDHPRHCEELARALRMAMRFSR